MDNYKKDLAIDRYKLEEELVRQPQLYMTWALKASAASIDTAIVKNRLEIVKADIDKLIRRNPKRYGFPDGKVTESGVKLEIAKNPKTKRYFKKYLDALHDEKILTEAKNAFQHRKKMLESLVSLNVQLHFAEPRVTLSQQKRSYDGRRDGIKRDLKRRKGRR